MEGHLVVAFAVLPVSGGILPHVHEGVAIWGSNERFVVRSQKKKTFYLLHDRNQQVDHHHCNENLVPENNE